MKIFDKEFFLGPIQTTSNVSLRKEGAFANFIDHEWVSFCHSLQTYQLWLEGTRQLLTWNHSVEFANPKTPSCFFAHLLQCILHCCHPPVVHCLRHPSSFRGEAPQGYPWSGRHSMYPTKKATFKRPAKHQARHLDRCWPLTLEEGLEEPKVECSLLNYDLSGGKTPFISGGNMYLYLEKFECTDCISAHLHHDISFWQKKLEQTESASNKSFKQKLAEERFKTS